MESLLQDIRFAFRSLRRRRLLTLVAAFSLAIGIGANAAIFSAVDVFMFRPFSYPEPEDLGFIWTTNQERGWTSTSTSIPDFLDWREESRTMELAAFRGAGVNLSTGEAPERLSGYRVSWNFLDVIGYQPAQGRSFSVDEERAGGARVVLLGHGIWERLFGSDPGVIGTAVLLDGEPSTVVGILPPRFQFGYTEPQLLMPLGVTGEEGRDWHELWTLARVRDGFSREQANTEIAQLEGRIARAFPETSAGNSARLLTVREEMYDEGFREGSLISSIAVLFVLLIACANVANLLLARSAGREAEIGLRAALGADRWRIVRQLLTESLLLALLGGGLGLFFGELGIRGLVSIMPPDFFQAEEITLNGRVLSFAAAVTLFSGFLFGLAPALQSASPDLRGALHEGTRGSTGSRGGKLRRGLVVGEIALAMVLLVSSALLVQSFWRLRSVDLGFNPESVLAMEMDLPESKYGTEEELGGFQRDLLARAEALPGVESVGLVTTLPSQGHQATFYTIPEQHLPDDERRPVVGVRTVSPDYFGTMEIPLVQGRLFDGNDDATGPLVILINETFRNQHWSEGNPLGEFVEFQPDLAEIVGVVGDVRVFGPTNEAPAMIYFSSLREPDRNPSLVLRTSVDPLTLAPQVRDLVSSIDPDQPVYGVTTMRTLLREATGGDTIMAKIMGVLAVVAFLLALVGVYGVMAYTVSRRLQEIGIRMALGADSAGVRALILKQGAFLAATGIGLGALLSLGVTKGLSFFLFGVSPFHFPTFVGVAGALLCAAVVATILPAQRATRIDPIDALRSE